MTKKIFTGIIMVALVVMICCAGLIMGVMYDYLGSQIYLDLENPMVKLLMDIYRNQTGDETSEPLVIGGGTYARATPNIIAYGAAFPGDEDLMHQKNECMSVERFRQMTKIYTEAIYKLASGDYNI